MFKKTHHTEVNQSAIDALHGAANADWKLYEYPAYIPVTKKFQELYEHELEEIDKQSMGNPRLHHPDEIPRGWQFHDIPIHVVPIDIAWFGVADNGDIIDKRPPAPSAHNAAIGNKRKAAVERIRERNKAYNEGFHAALDKMEGVTNGTV